MKWLRFASRTSLSQIFLLIILVSSFIFGLYDLNQPMIAEGDSYSRALIGKKLFEKNVLFDVNSTNVWLPLHFTLINLPAWFGFELFYGQRLITLALSCLSIAAIFYYTKTNTKGNATAILASVLFAILPIRYVLATQTLSEPIFVFFFIFSVYFLTNGKNNFKNNLAFIGTFFISGILRFESWIFVPVILAFIWLDEERSKKDKNTLTTMIAIVPTAWIIQNFFARGNFLSFFKEKYEIAANNPIPSFYNWGLSMSNWLQQLQKSLPMLYLLLAGHQLSAFFKKPTPKRAIFYLTPIYLFLSLVLQVYFGTMEWFPLRYLLIPISFTIPIVAESIVSIFEYYIKTIFKAKKWLAILTTILVVILFYSLVKENKFIAQKTQRQLTTLAFLSLEEESHLSADKYQKIKSFNSVVLQLKKHYPNISFVEFFYSNENRSWQDQALFYMLDSFGVDLPKESYKQSHHSQNIVVWEKEPNEIEPYWLDEFEVLYENQHYYLIR